MNKIKENYVKALNVLYEDNHLIVVEKFCNVLSQKDRTNDIDMGEIIKSYLKEKYQKPGNVYLGLVHRLDRRVGGVMVFAKTSKAASRLSEDIRNHEFTKIYLAKVQGILKENGKIEIKLEKENQVAIVKESGKNAFLEYEVLGYDKEETYVLIKLKTGRYNQIRVSFMHIGHPIINDYKYDKSISPTQNDIGLWCYKIGFKHPVTKKELLFTINPHGNIWKKIELV